MSNSDIVGDFCASWSSLDIDAIMGFFAEDAVYYNIPMEPPSAGKAMIRQVIETFMADPDGVQFEVLHQAENSDGVVMNERIDRFYLGDHTITMRVMGVFELADGKITAWRDYFDLNEYLSQLPQQ